MNTRIFSLLRRRRQVCRGNDGKQDRRPHPSGAEQSQVSLLFPADAPETVPLIDDWENQATIDTHPYTPMIQAIMVLREKHNLRMRVERYVSDAGIPELDKNLSESEIALMGWISNVQNPIYRAPR